MIIKYFNSIAVPVQEGGFLFVNWGTAILRVPYEPNITNPGYPIQLQANQIPIGNVRLTEL